MPELIDAALAELGVRRLLLAIHDVSFPSDPAEDLGRGSPATAAATRLLGFARGLGFTGLQLGPQGQTSRTNPSPYDSTIFARHTGTIALSSLRPGEPFEGLVSEASLDRAVLAPPGGAARHQRAHDVTQDLLAEAHTRLHAGARPDLGAALTRFRDQHAGWLERDALFAVLGASHGGTSVRTWPEHDRALWHPAHVATGATATRVRELTGLHAAALERHALGQLLAHEEHARVRARCALHGLALYGDLQVGYAEADAWAYAAAFLPDYVMGAPPSRTNPDGQPWNYPVLDPAQFDGAARALVFARVDKALSEYDSLRIDHPHGLVCPWVYHAASRDPARAVRAGARLYESPDLPDHPGLARFAIATAAQLERGRPRHADGWVTTLTDEQIACYAVLFEVIAEAARGRGRALADLSCEVLSTMPLPLQRVLERFGLGRWRVTQKANLDDPEDVYRSETARPEDWVMLGNHDTAPIFALLGAWSDAERARWTAHLSQRLALAPELARALPTSTGLLATAMLAELFACRAENVSIFFADLFGIAERFNAPGTVSDENWSLRLPPDFDVLYAARHARREVLDVRLALALALDARGSRSGLATHLRADLH